MKKPLYRLFITHIVNIKKFNDLVKPLHSERRIKLNGVVRSFKKNFNGRYHKEILKLIKSGISRKRDILAHLKVTPNIINNNLMYLKRNGFIWPKERFITNKGGYFLYSLTDKGEDFLNNESGSFFD